MWLQSHDEFDIVAAFNPVDGSLERLSRTVLGSDAPVFDSIDGWFSDHADGALVLYWKGGAIFFRIRCEGTDKEFELDETTEISVVGPPPQRELTVYRNGVSVYRLNYSPQSVFRSSDDPTAFIDEEDFDFGLFASNISKDRRRKEVFYSRG